MPISRLLRIDHFAWKGVEPSHKGQTPAVWELGENVVFAERSIQPTLGSLELARLTGPVVGLESNSISTQRELFSAADGKLWKWNESSGLSQIASGLAPDELTIIESWGEWVVATNGVDPVQVYKGGSFQPLAGTTFSSAEIVVRQTPYLLAFNLGGVGLDEKVTVAWCETDNIEDWTPQTTNRAGSLVIRDLESPIIAALPLGDHVVFYAKDSMHRIFWTGGNIVFGHDRMLEGIGPVGKFAVVERGRSHYGFSVKGPWVTDGNDFQYIGKGAINDYIFENINRDPLALSRVVAWHDELEEHIVFFYPEAGCDWPSKAVAFNYRRQDWSIWNYGRTAAESASVFDYGITGDSDGGVFYQQSDIVGGNNGTLGLGLQSILQFNSGYGSIGFGQEHPQEVEAETQSIVGNFTIQSEGKNYGSVGTAQDIIARTKPIDLGSTYYMKLSSFYIEVDPSDADIEFRFGLQQELCENVVWGEWKPVCKGKIERAKPGRFLTIEFRATGNTRWKLTGIEVFGSRAGRQR